jgi:ankyrin repeat protein
MKLVAFALAASILCPDANLAMAQEANNKDAELETTLKLVVMINAQMGDFPVFGSGIVFAREKNRLYIVTANHVVRRGSADATHIRVNLRSRPSKSMTARLLPLMDSAMDLAVLAIDDAATQGADVCALRMYRLGDPGSLERGDDVYPVGNPNGVAWGMPVTPGQVSGVTGGNIAFQSAFIAVGLSGGALLDADSRLVGVVLRDEPPLGAAISLDKVLEAIDRWKLPQQLRQAHTNEWDSTPLYEAVWQGQIQTVKNLLAQACPDVTAVDKYGETPLHYAAAKGYGEIVRLLLEAGANVNGSEREETPLHIAAEYGAIDAARVLVAAGANLNPINENGFTPLQLAIDKGHAEVAEVLLKGGADANVGISPPALNSAAKAGDPELVRMLIHAGAKVNPPSDGSESALETAALHQRLEAMAVLLSAGADARRGVALHIAAKRAWIPGMKLLLGAGARSTDADESGQTPLMYAVESWNTAAVELAIYPDPRLMLSGDKRKNLLCTAYRQYRQYRQYVTSSFDLDDAKKTLAVFKVLLAHSNQSVNVLTDKECEILKSALFDSDGEFLRLILPPGIWEVPDKIGALIDSLRHGGSKGGVAKAMISAGVDLNATDSTGYTALHKMLSRYPNPDDVEVVRLLVAGGAKANTRSSDPEWNTPLHTAVIQHWPRETLKLLMTVGGNPSAKDFHGETPISLATDDYQRSELSSRTNAH